MIKFGCFRNNLAENKNEKKQDKEIIYFKKASGHSKDFVDEKEVYSSDYFASKKESRKSPKIKKDAETKIDIDEKTFKWKLICLLGKIRKIEDSFPTLFTQEIEINLPFTKHLKAAFSKLSSFWKLIFQHLPEFIEQTKVFFKDHVHLLFKSTKENYERIDRAESQKSDSKTTNLKFKSFNHVERYQKKVRLIVFGFSSTLALIIIASLLLEPFSIGSLRAATYYFNQADWSGGATANNASHVSDQTGWNQYSAKDSTVDAGSGGVSLTQKASQTITDNGNPGALAAISPATIATGAAPYSITISADGASVYVVNYSSNTISMYSRDTSTGALTALSPATIATENGPWSITISADMTSVYAVNSTSRTISMYSRDTSTGALTALSPATIATGTNPYDIAISTDGASVYVSNFGSNTISMYSRNISTGVLTELSPVTVVTGTNPYDIAISTDGTSAYVTNFTSKTISMYSRNISTGVLTALGTPTITTGSSPRGITISADGASIYVTNSGGNTVSMYSRNTSTGALTALSPATIATGTTPYNVTIFSEGTSVYVANYDSNTISMYSRNVSTGALTALSPAIVAAGTMPRDIIISADGNSVYVANKNSSNVSMYNRNTAPGFSGGTLSSTAISGSGASATVGLITNASTNFTYTGGVQSFIVPSHATSITITVNGAGGGYAYYNGSVRTNAGKGGSSVGTLSVTPGETYYILVGGTGGSGTSSGGGLGGYGGGGRGGPASAYAYDGGGGGGMTWFSTQNTFTQGTVILVAGGGGGASTYGGGNGGGTTGAGDGGYSGYGGTQSAGGLGGTNNGCTEGSGLAGLGGAWSHCNYGGGGGGGYYGGGAGSSPGAGGGGSGYVKSNLTAASTTQGTGAIAGANGSASVSYTGLSSGTFTSGVINTGAISTFATLSYSATLNGQTLTMDARAGNTVTPDETWTDWTTGIASGGNINALSGNQYIQYRANFSTTNTAVTPTLSSVTINYVQYNTSGTLTSSIYDSGDVANVIGNLVWNASGTSATENVKFQIRVASTIELLASAPWCGSSINCDGNSYFTESTGTTLPIGHPLLQGGGADRYFQYKVFLNSGGSATPTLTEINVHYVVNAPPQFDPSFGVNGTAVSQISDSNDTNYGKVKIQYSIRDIDTTTGSFTPNYVTPTFEYTLNGTDWLSVNTDYIVFDTAPSGGNIIDFNSDGKMDNKISESNYLTYTIFWDAKTQIDDNYSDAFQVRTIIDDNESANRTATAASAVAVLDTKNPTTGIHPILIDGSTTSNNITLSVSDDTNIQMKVGLNSDLSDVTAWEDYSIKKTISLVANPETVYTQFRDQYGNTSAIFSATTPETPTAMMIQDTSNLYNDPDEYRLFIAWKAIANIPPGFISYRIYREESNTGPWTNLLYTITDRGMNYYGDSTVDFDKNYYYKIKSTDIDGNVSYPSATVNGKANGTQDAGENGGGTPTDHPEISNVQISSKNTTQAIITWDTDILSNSTVGYSTTPGSFLHETGVAYMQNYEAGVGQHRVVLSELSPSTTYYFRVISSDSYNNQGIDDNGGSGYSFSTLSGPIISNITIPDVKDDSATIKWMTNSASDSFVVYSADADLSDSTETGNSALVTNHAVTISGLSLGTKYYFYVKSGISIDDNSTNYYILNTLAEADTDPPDISDINSESTDNISSVITWKTNEPATSQIRYGTISGSLTSETVLNSNLNIDHAVSLINLLSDTRYYYRVISKDESNNETISDEKYFNTNPDPKYQHDPLSAIMDISDPPSIITDTKAVVTFNTDQAAKCAIEYGTATSNYSEVPFVESDYNVNHSIHLTGLIFSTQYFYRISCMDNLNNTKNSDEYNFTTLQKTEEGEDGDNTAPDIGSISVSGITGENVVISWKTNEKASSLIRYGITADYGNMAGNDIVNSDKNNYVTSHLVNINNLTPGTKYYYKIISSDLYGNIGESSEQTFSTKAPSSLSSIKVVSNSLKEAVITWSTSTKMTSIVEYGETEEYGEKKESSTASKKHEVAISGLKSGTSYHFRVKGKDENGNLYSSGDYTFQPKSPPKVSGVTLDSVSEHGAKIIVITDIPTDILVTYFEKDQEENSGSQGKPEFVTQHDLELNNLKSGTAYAYTVKVVDEQGNQTVSDENTFITNKDENPPKIENVRTDSALTQNNKVQTIISWKTDEQATSILSYREGRIGEEKEFSNTDSLFTNHVIVMTSFKSGTVYNFRVKSTDAAGNESISGYFSFLTPRVKENIIQIITNNFMEIFGWAGTIGK